MDDATNTVANGSQATPSPKVSKATPTLSKAGYSSTPSISELQLMSSEDLAAVPNFSVERNGVGKVVWQGAVDVRGADLDSLIVIEPKSIQVYSEEENTNSKPPIGTKLNRPAVLTMWRVFPRNGSDPKKFSERVARQTDKMGADVIKYDVESGEWVLLVKHFR